MTEGLDQISTQTRVYVESQIEKIQGEIDRRIATQRRESDALKDHFERLLSERDLTTERFMSERSERLSVMREKLEGEIEAIRRELMLINGASERAIAKADTSNHERFVSHNGLIEQMRQQAVKAEQVLAKLVGELLPREAFEAWKNGIEKQLGTALGERQGIAAEREERRVVTSARATWIGVALTVIWVLVGILSIALATHGFTK